MYVMDLDYIYKIPGGIDKYIKNTPWKYVPRRLWSALKNNVHLNTKALKERLGKAHKAPW